MTERTAACDTLCTVTLSQVHRDVRGDWLRAGEPSCVFIMRSAVTIPVQRLSRTAAARLAGGLASQTTPILILVTPTYDEALHRAPQAKDSTRTVTGDAAVAVRLGWRWPQARCRP